MKQIFIIITLLLLSTASFSTHCYAFEKSAAGIKGIHGHVLEENGSPVFHANVTTFDGVTLKEVITDTNGEFNISDIPVSKNNYLVIFFAKEGFTPMAENIKAGEEDNINMDVVLKKVEPDGSGFIIGVVYQPIRGGKLQYHNGIKNFSYNKNVLLDANGRIITKETNMDGHFLFEVPAGRYTISKEGGKEKFEIDISPGKTLIKNLRSGFILID